MKEIKTKRCPRCQTKNGMASYRCSECGLVFSRVENGSNQLAKSLILAGKKNYTVNAKMFPKDVSKKKFLLLSGFLGLFGAHNFYVGRYKKAVIQLIFGIVIILCVAIGHLVPFYDRFMSFASVPIGLDVFICAFDFIDAIFNKYKIPVAVDYSNGGK